jgi:hypothetical protein
MECLKKIRYILKGLKIEQIKIECMKKKNIVQKIILFFWYLKRGAIINNFGSIISPKEIQVRESIKFQNRISDLKELIRPEPIIKTELKKYGSRLDGGYDLPKSVVKISNFLISGGIANNNDFEIELARGGIKGIQIDNSIYSPPKLHENLQFLHATLGSHSGPNLEQIAGEFEKNWLGILKLDIEGSEYEVLRRIKNFSKFSAIVVEFHGLYQITNEEFWENFKKIFLNLRKDYSVVYIAPNNCCSFSIIGGFAVPNVLEITWAKRKLIARKKSKNYGGIHPNKLAPNISQKAQLDVSTFFPEN